MSDKEFKAKCLLLDIEIESLTSTKRWVIWNGHSRDKRDWRLFSTAEEPHRPAMFPTRELALKAYTTNKGKYIWD